MDLPLFARVLWRFRLIVAGGVVLALGLSFLSVVRVSASNHPLTYRQQQKWISYETLFVTQRGFPWGSLGGNVAETTRAGQPLAPAKAGSAIDPIRFTSLAIVYSQLADSDPVQRLVRQSGPIDGEIQVAPILASSSQEALPIISIAGIASSPARAISLARREGEALRTFILSQQSANGIADRERVELVPLKVARTAKIFAPRRMTLPIVVFLTVLIATALLAFVLENSRPRVREVSGLPARSSAA